MPASIRRQPINNKGQANEERILQSIPQDTQVVGRVLVKGSGEALATVEFPVRFAGKPLPILGGAELPESANPVTDYYPEVNSTVIRWKTFTNAGGTTFYTGATLSIVVRGTEDQSIWSSYSFLGTALTTKAGDPG